jgi:hypothetical protein
MAMTRRRVVTPEGFSRDELLSLPPAVRLTEIGLRLYADDHGREKVNQRLMLARLYPLDRERRESDIDDHLLQLDEAGVIVVYDAAGETYFALTHWPKVDRPNDSRFPDPPSRSNRESFSNDSWRGREGEGESERGEGGHARTNREGLPPDPFCQRHPEGTLNGAPCRECGTARLRRQKWDDEQIAEARRVIFEEGDV